MESPSPEPACKRNRHHAWKDGMCLACGKEQPKPRAAGGARTLGDKAARIQSLFSGATAPQESQPTPPASMGAQAAAVVSAPPPAPTRIEPDTTDKWIARRMTRAFVGLNQLIAEKRGRRERDPDKEDVAQFEGALARKLHTWFPDGPLSDTKLMFMCGFLITTEIQCAPKATAHGAATNGQSAVAIPALARPRPAPAAEPPPPPPAPTTAPTAATASPDAPPLTSEEEAALAFIGTRRSAVGDAA